MRRSLLVATAVALLSSCGHGPTTVAVSGVDLSERSLVLLVGQEKTLTATVRPEDATNPGVSWFSSNTGVASVTDGLVKALSEGTATVTVKTDDGGFEDSALVTVVLPTMEVGGSGVVEEYDYGIYH